ncbi:MAG: Ppx/GppA family phosphatase [Rhodospirillales bacterium]|nr:MAG: Ppx/GppA family phosphatase [Rhodospirillales bacterium]
MPAPVYAAIDLGTHNCRLLIAKPASARGCRVIEGYSRPVRLGEGLDRRGELSPEAVERALDALRCCIYRMHRAGVRRVRAVATEPCRQAANATAFVAEVKRQTGLRLERLSADDEIALTLAGCQGLLTPHSFGFALLVDIGGGSTEVSWIEQRTDGPPRVLAFLSIPCGVVTFAERYGSDRVPPATFAAMVEALSRHLERFPEATRVDEAIRAGRVQMLATSGTVTTLGACYLRLKRYQRSRVDGLTLSFRDLAVVSATLAATSLSARAANPCIGVDRADLVVAGCAILQAVCRRWPVGRLTVADRGIREGLLAAMMAEDGFVAARAVDEP